MTDAEEQQLGEGVSLKIRTRYGVVQDPAVHKYVSLVGTALALGSTRPTLAWKFIVLDTDGVNAFAAPGGYIHITRGALGLLEDESELADVLAHEIIHVTDKHTIRAIQKGKMVQMGATESLANNPALLTQTGREKHRAGAWPASAARRKWSQTRRVWFWPARSGTHRRVSAPFLTRLTERNKASTEKQGLFASHPGDEGAASEKYQADCGQEARRCGDVGRPLSQVHFLQAARSDRGRAGGRWRSRADRWGRASTAKPKEGAKEGEKPPEEKKRGFGLSTLVKPGGGEKKSAEVTGSGASRGVDTERNAKGGAVATPVTVAVTAAELAAFKKEGGLT